MPLGKENPKILCRSFLGSLKSVNGSVGRDMRGLDLVSCLNVSKKKISNLCGVLRGGGIGPNCFSCMLAIRPNFSLESRMTNYESTHSGLYPGLQEGQLQKQTPRSW